VLPNSLSQVGIVTKYELLNYFRSRRFFVLLIIGLLISGLLTALVGYYRPSGFVDTPLHFYAGWWGNFAILIIVLSGIFFGGDAISGEFQNKTGYYLVPNPLRRSSIYVGKWIAALLASLIVIGEIVAITLANGFYYFGVNVPVEFGYSLLLAVMYLTSVLGVTFFFSSLFKSSSMSILVTAILFLFVFTLIQTLIVGFVKIEPWFMITYGSETIGNVLQDTYPAHVTTGHIRGPESPIATVYNVTIPEGIAIMVAYFVVTGFLGLVLFERKEFT
jgi:ABC-2 type transport system permease protein